MRKFSSQMAIGALVAVLGLATAGCSQIGRLKAKMAFKDAQSAVPAAGLPGSRSEVRGDPRQLQGLGGDCTDPKLTYAYFFLGNSYDNQFRPARRGEATNDSMLTKAIDNYKKSHRGRAGSEDQEARHGVPRWLPMVQTS